MLRSGARRLHTWLAWVFVAAILVQVFLAGLAIFRAIDGFGLHVEFGYTAIGPLTLGVLLTAVAGGLPRREVAMSLMLLVLYVVQTALPSARASAPVIAAFHPVNALVMFALGTIIARRGSVARNRVGSA